MPRQKKPLKKIVKSKFVQTLFGRLIYLYVFFVYKTSYWKYEGLKEEYFKKEFSFLVAFWHGRALSDTFVFLKKKFEQTVSVLVSMHRDGRVMASAMDAMGIKTIDGSSKKGGASAALEIVKKLQKGENIIALAPDGRKPGYKMTQGVIGLAKQSQRPIILSAFSVKRGKMCKTWDKFLIPYPFNKGVIFFSEPIYIPESLTSEETEKWREDLENQLIALTEQADKFIGLKNAKPLREEHKKQEENKK